jgi:Flp pilus assembly protein TadB
MASLTRQQQRQQQQQQQFRKQVGMLVRHLSSGTSLDCLMRMMLSCQHHQEQHQG